MSWLTRFAQVDLSPLPKVDAGSTDPLTTTLNIVFSILGAVALIVIIISGIRFVLSRGDPQGVANARQTIIYAAIGLAVAVSALSIVNFVIGKL